MNTNINKIFYLLIASLFCNVLGAYTFFGIPFPWASSVLAFASGLLTLRIKRKVFCPGMRIFFVFFVLLLLITIIQLIFGLDEINFVHTTTPLPVYVSLRFLGLLSFWGAAQSVYFLCCNGFADRLIRSILIISCIVCLYALYTYMAQLYGLPEIWRNRLTTGGGHYSGVTRFSYAFHRATGSFREPSHLAEWLLMPLSYVFVKNIRYAKYLFFLVLMLTGSMTGIISFAVALILTLFFVAKLNPKFTKKIFVLSFTVFVAGVLFSIFAKSYSGGSADLFSVILTRMTPVVDSGIEMSNRGYIYEYFRNSPPPFFGQGFGLSNLIFSNYLGIFLPASFLNLYISVLYGGGYFCLFVLLIFLLFPYVLFLRRSYCDNFLFWSANAYISYVVSCSAHTAELTINMGIVYALFCFVVNNQIRESA